MDTPKFCIPLALHHSMDRGDTDVVGLSPSDPILDGAYGHRHIDGADPHT
jgi:hypothetical protein